MSESWILDVTKELQLSDTALEEEIYAKSIYLIPKIIKDVNCEAYTPKIASFGPYHSKDLHLRPMEQYKQGALIKFLRRIAKASKTIDDVIIAMRKVELQLLASYDSLHIKKEDEHCFKGDHFPNHEWLMEKDEFLKLMIVDGCFALEIMLSKKRIEDGGQSEYDSCNPVLGCKRMPYILHDLRRDMLLFENQLPLLALTTLAAIEGSKIQDVSALVDDFYDLSFASWGNQLTDKGLEKPTKQSFHILDIYKKMLTAEGGYYGSCEVNVNSATKLRNAGVSFCKSKTRSFSDISFNDGVLSLPQLEIYSMTKSILLNLMAFERLHVTTDNKVTTYVFFMDRLLNTTNDVALLRNEEIFIGCYSDESILKMFKTIMTNASLLVFYDDIQDDVNAQLNSYCKKSISQLRVNLVPSFVETYLKNPWVFSSLLGALFLLALTVVQTVFTVLQFYN